MYLSYSGWKKSDNCGFDYWLGYVAKVPLPEPDDRLGSIYGSVVGKLFEDFYNEEIYRQGQPQGIVMGRVGETIRSIIEEEIHPSASWKKGGVLKWKGTGPDQNPKAMYTDEAELAADVRDAVSRGFEIIRHHRLLGKGAQAEVPLDATILGHKLGGRADFIMRRVKPFQDEILLDGKGSRWLDAYVDKRQLQWYAMLFQERNKRLPDQLGFVFWRAESVEDAVLWVPVVPDEIQALKEQVLADIRKIEARISGPKLTIEAARRVFLPIAERTDVSKEDKKQACRFCSYAIEAICPAGAQIVDEKR